MYSKIILLCAGHLTFPKEKFNSVVSKMEIVRLLIYIGFSLQGISYGPGLEAHKVASHFPCTLFFS